MLKRPLSKDEYENMLIRPLTYEERTYLGNLNIEVIKAIKIRSQYLDSKMHLTRFKVNDDIFNAETGQYLGKVINVKRFNRDYYLGVFDSDLNVSIDYITPAGITLNSEDWPNTTYTTKEEEKKILGSNIDMDKCDLSNIINKE